MSTENLIIKKKRFGTSQDFKISVDGYGQLRHRRRHNSIRVCQNTQSVWNKQIFKQNLIAGVNKQHRNFTFCSKKHTLSIRTAVL